MKRKPHFFSKTFVLLSLLTLMSSTNLSFSQVIMTPGGSSTVCSGNFYDSGNLGGNYLNNENATHTITPSTPGAMLQANFTAFYIESGWDYLSVYNGPTTASPLIGTYTGTAGPGSVTSTDPTGALTFVFTSDGSVTYTGWEATLACIAPLVIVMTTGGSSSACSGNFYDSGNVGGSYLDNENASHTITPSTPGAMLQANFTSFNIESGLDHLSVYNGPSTASPLIGTYSGTTGPGTVISTDPSGSLTFVFTSDGSFTNSGWEATLACIAPPAIILTPGGSSSACSGNFYDSGNSGGNYLNNENATHTITPSTLGAKLQANFTFFNTEAGYDYLNIYNGPTAGSPLIGTYTGGTGPGTVISTHPSGALTFVFTSDGSITATGWAATLACISPPAIIMTPGGSSTACSGNFYDSGNSGGNYLNNENATHTITPATPGAMLQANFTAFDLESGFDYLNIYNGPNTASPLIGAYTGTVGPGVITSTDPSGALTFVFASNGSVTPTGWSANLACITTPLCTEPDEPSVIAASAATICSGASATLDWTGYLLNDATAWSIYEGTCGGTLVGTSVTNSLSVSPTATTSYFIRGEGGCTTPGICGTITITVGDAEAPMPDAATLADVYASCEVTSLTVPTATDNCSGTVTVTNDATLPITTPGPTMVTWTYDDGNGNTTTQTQNVIITGLDLSVNLVGETIEANSATSSYQWIDCDNGNAIIAGATNQTFAPAVTGNYAVILSESGCTDTSSCYLVQVSGLNEHSANIHFTVQPNPSNGIFNLSIDGMMSNKVSVTVHNTIGQILYSTSVNTGLGEYKMIIDLSANESGVYIVNILGEDETTLMKRIVKL